MPALDWSVLLPIITAFIPILLPLFPGLNQILKTLPRSFWTMCVGIVAPGATITWPPNPAVQRAALEARRAALLGRTYAGTSTADDAQALAATEEQLAAIAPGGILQMIMSLFGGGGGSMLPILLIVGVVVLPMIMGDGCKKKPTPAPAPAKAAPVVIDANHP